MKKMIINICHYALYVSVKGISHIPFRLLYILSDILYFPVYHIIRYRRKTVRNNLIESFPDKDMNEIRRIEKKFYHFFVDLLLESSKLMSITPKEMRCRMKFKGIEYVNQLFAQGKSVSLFLGHYGNWEWVSSMGMDIDEHVRIAQVYRQLSSKVMDNLMKHLRSRFGHISVEMNCTARFINKVSQDNRPCFIGFIADQSPRKRERKHYVRFLSHNVPVQTGSERITKHYGYEAVFLSMKRLRRGYYVCEFSSLHDNPPSLPNFKLTELYYHRLEKEIAEEPSLYLWTHKRFKYATKL